MERREQDRHLPEQEIPLMLLQWQKNTEIMAYKGVKEREKREVRMTGRNDGGGRRKTRVGIDGNLITQVQHGIM